MRYHQNLHIYLSIYPSILYLSIIFTFPNIKSMMQRFSLTIQLYRKGQCSKWKMAWELRMELKHICFRTLIKSILGLLLFLCKMRETRNIYTLQFTKHSLAKPPTQCWVLRLQSPMSLRAVHACALGP